MSHPGDFEPTQAVLVGLPSLHFHPTVEGLEPTQASDVKCCDCNGFNWLLGLSPANICTTCPEGRAEKARRDQMQWWSDFYSGMATRYQT